MARERMLLNSESTVDELYTRHFIWNGPHINIDLLGVGQCFAPILKLFMNDANVLGYVNRGNLVDSRY